MRDALALAAGEFVRIAAHVLGLQPDLDQQARHAVVPLAGRGGELVDDQRFAEDRADRHARIERGERILEDDLHLAPHGAQIVAAEAQHVLPVERRSRRRGLDQAQHAAARGGLAAAGLADQSERLAAIDRKATRRRPRRRCPTSRDKQAAQHRKMLLEIGDAEQGFAHAASPRWQAMRWPGAISRKRGSLSLQTLMA